MAEVIPARGHEVARWPQYLPTARNYRSCSVAISIRAFIGLTAALLLIAFGARPATAQEPSPTAEVSAANRLYQQALEEAAQAVKLERRGKKPAAIDSYEHAGQLCEAGIAEAERTGMTEETRPPEVYFRCAASYLHAGRLLAHLKNADEARKDEDLRKAVQYLDSVDKIETQRAQRSGGAVNPEIWRVRNAAGYACFLRGELAQARLHYKAVLELNPTYTPAEEAVAEINKLEQQQNELFTPQGHTRKNGFDRQLLRGLVDTLKLVRDIVKLGI